MKVPSFLRLFGQRWLGGSARRGKRRQGVEAARRARRNPLQLDALEDRTLLATPPAPQVLSQTILPGLTGQGSTPSVAVDPLSPQRAVAVFTGLSRPANQPPTARIGGAFTTNGGQTWSQFIPDPFLGTARATQDPTSNPMQPTAHRQISDASVSFDRNGNFYVLRLEHDETAPYNQNGAVILEKYNFSSGIPVKVTLPGEIPCFGGLGERCGRVLYQWTEQDPAIAPTLVVDNTLPTFTDPDTGQVQSNPSAGTIYVAFGSNDAAPPNTQNFNGNSIRILASSDGGNSWGASSYPTGFRGTFETSPRLTVSQGTADGRVRGGQVTMTWVNFSQSGDPPQRPENRRSFIVTQGLERGVGLGFAGVLPDQVPVAILDALDTGMVHTPRPTLIPINVNITHQGFTTLRDLEVTLSLSHANTSELLIELITPSGEIINLVTNRTLSNGQARPGNPAPGLNGANLGWDDGVAMGTRFDADAVRAINTGPNAPFAQRLRPEFPLQIGAITLDQVRGRTAAQLNGQWLLRITDMRNSPPTGNTPPQQVYWAELNMSSGLTAIPGASTSFANLLLGSNLAPYPGIVRGNNAPARPSVYPDHGFLSGPVLASDNTLGSFSPNQGRLYLAYADYVRVRNVRDEDLNPIDGQGNFRSTNTDIFLISSDDGGRSWSAVSRQVNDDDSYLGTGSDGTLTQLAPGETLFQTGRLVRPAGGLPQFMPEIVVDQATGTVAVSFLDARHDPEGKRVATYITYSVDGGQTFSPQVFVNVPHQARDAATGQNVLIEPFLDNQSSNHPRREDVFGFGTRLGLALYQGRLYSAWSGNQNVGRDADTSAGLSIFAAVSTIPGGPRIVSSTMGPVKATTVPGTGVTFNNNFAPDGTRLANAFYIEFDRPVDPSTFNADAVTVVFRTPTTPSTAPGIPLDILTVLPLNAGLFGPARAPGATQFLVQFDPSKALSLGGTYVGTYSYSIKPLVRDRLRLAGINVAPGATFNFSAQPPETNLRLPPVGTGGSGVPAQDITNSRITVAGLPANQQITKVTVNVNILHTFDFDLGITLIAPDGTRTLLSLLNGGSGDNYTDTTFDDDAATPIFFGAAPFTGRFRPDDPAGLRKLIGRNPNGVWTLEVRDYFQADSGTVQNWSLSIQTGIVSIGITQLGNRMDQNSNGAYGEEPGDIYATPRPLTGVPFRPPYDQTTSPLIVPGPTVVSTRVPGNPQTPDNLVLNSTVSALDVVFDRDMDPASLTPAQIVRLMGPAGLIAGPFTITANPAGTDPLLARRTFRIGFPAQQLSGTYVLTLASSIRSAFGDAMDVNQNAGLDVLRDTASAGTTNAGVTFRSTTPVDLLPQKTVDAFLDVPENFVLQGVQLRLNITTADAPGLTATLIAPDGAEVRLFARVGQGGASRANFTNTTFDDNAAAAIQRATAPFFGSFAPQQPLSRLQNRPAGGRWRLRLENASAASSGRLTDWTLTLFKAVPNTGLGELAADQTSVSFRIFTLSNANPLSKSAWTPVGPAPIGPGGSSANQNNGSRTGRIGGLAVDPSDPSGNTLYVAGASGGVWKTRNFLTTDINGPTYTPLTDFGPSFGTNIGGLAVFARNNDPNQSIVIAGTGEGDVASRGVGFLRSFDGGATWTVLDSTTNVDASGNPLPISSAQRDHIFVGSTVFKVVVDPKPTPSGETMIYAAVSDITAQDRASNRAGGIWRSLNSGRTWQRMRAGQATDVVLSPHSADGITGNLGIVFGAFRGEGVFISPNQGQVWNLMTGTVGNPLIRDGDANPPDSVPVNAGPAPNTPNGAKGRIALAVPEVTGNRALDIVYAGWLYAFVATTAGLTDGLYITKDFGQNWTRVRVPLYREPTLTAGAPSTVVAPSIDPRLADNDVFNAEATGQGNYDLSLVVDPTNPNVVYVGGSDGEGQRPFTSMRLMRVDTTVMIDPHAFIGWSSHDVNNGLLQAGVGGITLKDTRAPFILALISEGSNYQSFINTSFVNLVRDPNNVFLNDSLMLVLNVQNWTNTGADARWRPFVDVLEGSVDQHRVIAYRDPATGKARLVFGDDQGIFSGVDDGKGNLLRDVGGTPLPTGSRNGNLQITQFYAGAAQPSILAAEIAGSMFYGTNQDTGNPKSTADSVRTGNLIWRGVGGDGTGLATDQTGSGNAYAYLWPCCGGGPGPGFFRFTPPGSDPLSPGIARTFGLVQENQPGDTPDPQWPFLGGFNIAVNPINGNQLLISGAGTERGLANHGRIFRTRDAGLTWFQIGDTADLDGTNAQALAYGAPDPRAPQVGNLDDFIYAGTTAGRIFVTFTGGGGSPGNRWKDISQGLDGSPIQVIVTNPNRGSREAYAVTTRGVYFMADSSVTAPSWQNITGNLFSITHDPFGDRNLREPRLKELTSLAADWRYQLPNNGQAGRKFPVLYVAGEGGVFRSSDGGGSWKIFPDTSDGSGAPGGFLPNARVTDLDLVLGNINPTTGLPDQSAGFNMLVASTFGRGVFATRLPELPGITPFSGPRVVAVDATSPVSPGFNAVTLTFSGPVDPETFTTAAIRSFIGPNGTVNVTSVQDLQDPITRQPPHTTYRITFTGLQLDGVYTLVLGPNLTDFGGNAMNQNGNTANGEEPTDRFTIKFVINTSDNGRFVTGLFNDLLRRRSDTNGFLQFIDPVDAARAQALGPVARTFSASAEARALLIATYYSSTSPTMIGNFLRRPAKPAEIDGWVQFLQAGGTPAGVVNAIVSSVEYFQLAGSSDLGFLTRLYTDLLGRGIDASGRDNLLQLLNQLSGGSRAAILNALNGSAEYYGNLVSGFYTKFLGRPAAAGDLAFWVPQLAAGASAESVLAAIAGSDEYFQRKGGNNPAFVAAVFADVLGRPIDPATQAVLLGQLAAGASRQAVAAVLLTSDEYRGNLVRGYYSTFLGRTPAQGEVDGWVAALRAGFKDEAVITSIMASDEYLARAGGTSQGFVDRAYLDLLGRSADAAGRDSFLLSLAQAQSGARASVASLFTTSAEYLTRIITTTYQTYLRRLPGSADINVWLPLLSSASEGKPGSVSTQEQFVGHVLGSGEYFLLNGNTNRNWVASLYTNFLRRAGGAAEIDSMLNTVLDFYTGQREALGNTISTSAEARRTFILSQYSTLLRRTPLDQEVDVWINLFQNGLREEQMTSVIIGSAEYFQRQASSNLTTYIDQAYQDLLGRARGANETTLLNLLQSGAITRQQATDSILVSIEYRRRVIGGFFRTYLNREGNLTDIDALAARVAQGARYSEVLATILGSREYFLASHPYP